MLTREGRALLVSAVVAAGAGRILGVIELTMLAVGLLSLLALAALSVLPRRLQLQVERKVHPTKVHAGSDSRIDVQIRNRASSRTPVLRLTDRVGGNRSATLLLAPLGSGRAAGAAYRLPTDRRGVLQIGPLDVVLSDPFGLIEVRERAAAVTELTVLPAVLPIEAPPLAPGDEPLTGTHAARSLAPTGGEFHSLRPYAVGDDLRRVHWRSTARRGDLMVRQDEQPWQGRVTVVLDSRASSHTEASLELAVTAAASILLAAWERGDVVTLVTTGPAPAGGTARGNAQVEALMEDLAALAPSTDVPLRRTLEPLSRDREGGTLVLITTALADAAEAAAVTRLRARFGTIFTIRFERSSWGDLSGGTDLPPPAATLVPVTADQPFAVAWGVALSLLRRRGAQPAAGRLP